MIITIDGPSGVGKGTLGRAVAHHYGFAYLDTGLLYRAVGYKLQDQGGNPDLEEDALKAALTLDLNTLDNPQLRSDGIAVLASKIAVFPAVRQALLEFQRNFAKSHEKGVVLDGRDLGTFVMPQADRKLFLTARPDIRAHRRLKELHARGLKAEYETVLKDLTERDERDSSRSIAPLIPAEDALIIDTSDLEKEEVLKKAIYFIDK